MSQQSSSNFDLYRVFNSVAVHKSLTKAAQELNVSQPAVSQSMKQLEANLGVKLTKRTGHGIKLTKEGEILYPYIKKGCDAFASAGKALDKYLNESHAKEDTTLKEQSKSTAEKESKSIIKKANIRFVADCFFTGTQYSHFTGQKLPYRILEHLPVILTKNDPTRENLNGFLRDNGIRLKPIAEYDTPEEVLYHVIHNDGIGCLPLDFIRASVESEDAYILDFEEAMPERIESLRENNGKNKQ